MLSIQHILGMMLAKGEKLSSRQIAAVVYPDAIRAYTGPRQYSHFEKSEDGTDISYMRFPEDMHAKKNAIEKSIAAHGHLVSDIRPCAIGENTDFDAFLAHNRHLTGEMKEGIVLHLQQDILFDRFIREQIDCSRKYEDIFFFRGQKRNGKELRALISEIEQQGIYVMSYILYQKYHVSTHQGWLEKVVRPALEAEYPKDLAEKTFSYMRISSSVNAHIAVGDWSKLGAGYIPLYDYMKFFAELEKCA